MYGYTRVDGSLCYMLNSDMLNILKSGKRGFAGNIDEDVQGRNENHLTRLYFLVYMRISLQMFSTHAY
jgi:hypothetical protein